VKPFAKLIVLNIRLNQILMVSFVAVNSGTEHGLAKANAKVSFAITYYFYLHGSYGQGKSGKVRENPDGQGKSGNSKVPWCKS